MALEKNSLPEITVKAVILGVVLSVILAGANAYLGLFAGMTVSASIPAAVMSMGILRFFRRRNILENNIVQTAASAGESLAAGVIFTLPALVILNYWTGFDFLWVTVIAGFGGLLGVLFTIPLRRALIVEAKLKFPEGIATAEVLKSGDEGGTEVKYIAQAAVAGGLFKLGASGLRIWTESIEAARRVGGSIAYFGSNLSPALLSVGYIVGLNIAVLVFLGGALNWFVAAPIVAGQYEWPVYELKGEVEDLNAWNVFGLEYKTAAPEATANKETEVQEHNASVSERLGKPVEASKYAWQIWSKRTRYIGVGGMLIGGLWTIIKLRTSIFSGIRSGLRAYRRMQHETAQIPRTERDMSMKWILVLIVASVVPLFIVYQLFVQRISISAPMAITMLLTGFLFSAVAGYMAGLVGSSNNPISGVTIATVLVSALLLLLLMGRGAEGGPAAAIIIGSVVCCAAAIAGDNMQDLKTGYIVQATPWKQQVMQMIGTVSAAFVMAPILTLLLRAYGFEGHASAKASPLAAPQANLMASVARGVFSGDLPWKFVWIGVALAIGVIILDEYLVRRGSSFRTPVLAVAIGIYLPFELEVPILIGGIIHFIVKAVHRKRNVPDDVAQDAARHGLLFASGLITGEALLGILLAIPIVLSGNPRFLALSEGPVGAWPGVILLVGLGYWLYRLALGRSRN